jgi:hypothetical protein
MWLCALEHIVHLAYIAANVHSAMVHLTYTDHHCTHSVHWKVVYLHQSTLGVQCGNYILASVYTGCTMWQCALEHSVYLAYLTANVHPAYCTPGIH